MMQGQDLYGIFHNEACHCVPLTLAAMNSYARQSRRLSESSFTTLNGFSRLLEKHIHLWLFLATSLLATNDSTCAEGGAKWEKHP